MSMTLTPADLPATIPVFPLTGALLLPRGELPLNIFEDRYMAMVRAALATPLRLIGMIQPKGDDAHPDKLFDVGCAGRINSFHETDDGRYLITLAGVCRFRVTSELPQQDGFRRVTPDFTPFIHDLNSANDLNLDRTRLLVLLKEYFHAEGLSCSWEHVKNASDDTLMTALSMICPFDSHEKQALLEAHDAIARGKTFMTLLELAVMQGRSAETQGTFQCH